MVDPPPWLQCFRPIPPSNLRFQEHALIPEFMLMIATSLVLAPRVLGFSIGVALGLDARREPETSLLAMGTTGIDLSASDIDRARRVAKTVTGVMTIDETQKAAAAAQAAGQADRAKRLRAWLAEVAAAKKADVKGRRAPRASDR